MVGGSHYQAPCACVRCPGFLAHLSPIGNTLPVPLWTLLSPQIFLTIKLKSFWVRIRIGLLLRYKVSTGKISVKFSFGLKIWNSFAPLTFSSCGGVQTHGDTTPGCHCSECSCFRLGNTFSSVFLTLRAYTLATIGKSLSELCQYFPHLNKKLVIPTLSTSQD